MAFRLRSGRELGQRVVLASLLVLAVLAVYGRTLSFAFVSFDDTALVTENDHVRRGLTWEGVRWAFALDPKAQTYWHPLTWVAHMLDCELFGLDAGGHHVTNVLVHAANVVTLFLLLAALTGAPRRSALVAALFALHPINVESVAWVAGLKNLLSTLFWLLATAAYVLYCRRPRLDRYLLALLLFALGLLAKPMLVTFPAVLLLLDWWPLGRLGGSGEEGVAGVSRRWLWLAFEKVPFALLAALAYAASALALAPAGNIVRFTDPGLGLRVANALVSYLRYLGALLWPHHLVVFYPYPTSVPLWAAAGAGLLLAALTWTALGARATRPWATVGWLWFLGTLVPVIGLVQTGLWPALADRWAYVPAIGVFIVATWAAHDLLDRLRGGSAIRWALASALLVTLGVCTWVQLGTWRSSFTLFRHTLDVDPDNYLGLTHLGAAYLEADDPARALPLFQAAVRVNPVSAVAHNGLGVALGRLGDTASARAHLERALAIRRDPATLANLGNLASLTGDLELAIAYFREAVERAPADPAPHNGLGTALAEAGRLGEAIAQFRTALRLDPANADARSNLQRCRRLLASGSGPASP